MQTPEERQAKLSRLRELLAMRGQCETDEDAAKIEQELGALCRQMAPWLLQISDSLAEIVDKAGDAYCAAHDAVESSFDLAASRAGNTEEQQKNISDAWGLFLDLGECLNVFGDEEEEDESEGGDEGSDKD